MKKLHFLTAILASILCLQFSWAQPGLYEVEAGAFYFSPSELIIEAGSTVFWHKYVGKNGLVIGVDQFGASAPASDLFKKFGLEFQDSLLKIEDFLEDTD